MLLGVVLATVSATAGLVTYVESSRHSSDRTILEVGYRGEISSLKARLASIERRLGSEEKTYFDVSQLTITPNHIKVLGEDYKTAPGGVFFYVEPTGDSWKYEVMSERDLFRLKIKGLHESNPQVRLMESLVEKNVYTWRKENVTTFIPMAKKGMEENAPQSMTFFPLVAVQTFDEKQFKFALTQGSDVAEKTSNLDKVGKEETSSKDKKFAQEKPDGQAKLDAEEQLDSLWRGDTVAMALAAFIAENIKITQIIEGASARINSVQKKGNVLYMQSTVSFASAKIAGQAGTTTLTIDSEVFVVATPKSMYMVLVEVPSTDGRSDAYAWVGQWLSGIRIPI